MFVSRSQDRFTFFKGSGSVTLFYLKPYQPGLMDAKRSALPGVGDVIPKPDCGVCFGVGTFLRLMPMEDEPFVWKDGKVEPTYIRAVLNCLCRLRYAA